MADFLTLEDAATRLGVSVDKLKEMRSQGEIFGFRDGSSWKFKETEISRVREELSGDVLGDDPGGSSILISEQNVGSSSSRLGSGLGPTLTGGDDSDLIPMTDDIAKAKRDVSLVPDPASSSGVRLVNRQVPEAEDDDEVLSVDESPADSGSSLLLGDLDLSGISGVGLGSGSDVRPAAVDQDSGELELSAGESSFSLQPGKGDSKAGESSVLGPGGSGGSGSHDDLIVGDSGADLDMDDDFALESEDSLALSDSSGINLTSGSDSGLSLDEPLDLAGTGISGINFGSDLGSAGGSGSNPRNAASSSGSSLSGIDFAPAGNFDLEPSGEMDFDDDSGSQVVEIDDQAAGDLDDLGGFDDADASGFDDPGVAGFDDETAGTMVGTPAADSTFGLWEVLPMLGAILLMCIAGVLVTDLARNLWAAAEGSTSNYNSTISNAVTGAIGY